MKSIDNHLEEIAAYYSAKLLEYGETARGVDWNSKESQLVRFEQLSRIINHTNYFSLNDLGCGYGALLDYLDAVHKDFSYTGYDISREMVDTARVRHSRNHSADFAIAAEPLKEADYGIASGIFNVRLDSIESEWINNISKTLDALDRTSRFGFAFNALTAYSDPDKKRDYLYYADPCYFFDFCKRRYSGSIALLHDYGLYEFTILVRKFS